MIENGKTKSGWLAWRKKYRYALQVAALILGVLAPFGIYAALNGGAGWLAALLFGLLAVAMLLTAWAG
jgi:hypothetical protein